MIARENVLLFVLYTVVCLSIFAECNTGEYITINNLL